MTPEERPTVEDLPTERDIACGQLLPGAESDKRPEDMAREALNNSDTYCKKGATYVVRIRDVQIATCGRHKTSAKYAAADHAAVHIAGPSEPRGRKTGTDKDPFNRKASDYNVDPEPDEEPKLRFKCQACGSVYAHDSEELKWASVEEGGSEAVCPNCGRREFDVIGDTLV